MNLIDYNKVMEALEKQRQLLLTSELYGAEHILVHYAINVVAELPIIQHPEIVMCKDCRYHLECDYWIEHGDNWFCADGKM